MSKSKIQQARDVISIQGDDGNWNYDPYMQGMYNGMELVLAIWEGREPNFKSAPDRWLSEISGTPNPDTVGKEEEK